MKDLSTKNILNNINHMNMELHYIIQTTIVNAHPKYLVCHPPRPTSICMLPHEHEMVQFTLNKSPDYLEFYIGYMSI